MGALKGLIRHLSGRGSRERHQTAVFRHSAWNFSADGNFVHSGLSVARSDNDFLRVFPDRGICSDARIPVVPIHRAGHAVFLYNLHACSEPLATRLRPWCFWPSQPCSISRWTCCLCCGFSWGVRGGRSSGFTVIARYVSGARYSAYGVLWQRRGPQAAFLPHNRRFSAIWEGLSVLTCVQQSVIIQYSDGAGLVNNLGLSWRLFAAAVKNSSFAYMPVQVSRKCVSTFVSPELQTGKHERIREEELKRRRYLCAVLRTQFPTHCNFVVGKTAYAYLCPCMKRIYWRPGALSQGEEHSIGESAVCSFCMILPLAVKAAMSVVLTVISLEPIAFSICAGRTGGVDGVIWAAIPNRLDSGPCGRSYLLQDIRRRTAALPCRAL